MFFRKSFLQFAGSELFLPDAAFSPERLEDGLGSGKFDAELLSCFFDGGLFGKNSLDEGHARGRGNDSVLLCAIWKERIFAK